MSDYRTLRELVLHAADQDRNTGTIDLEAEGDADWLKNLSGSELGDMLSEVDRLGRAIRVVKALVEAALLVDVQDQGGIRLGDYGYYAGTQTTRRLVDPDGLVQFLYDQGGIDAVRKAVRVNEGNVRINVVRGIASDNGHDPEAVVGQFFHTEFGETVLKKTPAVQARWIERLKEGERA